ncbi:hypothetical protein [uncultured Cohaesibacter sp.]|uniref:hypothetical protein n=1 Tax=uncultured Cohaesibacter sp. TaxID=1002546 RepID=UPI0029C997F0|nr:hypothetical protein [uncultured Cohaesibacter sp.]
MNFARKALVGATALILCGGAFVGYNLFLKPAPAPEPTSDYDLADAACEGSEKYLAQLEAMAAEPHDNSAKMRLRWVYINKNCKRYYSGYSDRTRSLLMDAANDRYPEALYLVASFQLVGNNGFKKQPKEAEALLYQLIDTQDRAARDAFKTLIFAKLNGDLLPQDLDEVERLMEWSKKNHRLSNVFPGDMDLEIALRRGKDNKGNKSKKAASPASNVATASQPKKSPTAQSPSKTKPEPQTATDTTNVIGDDMKNILVFTKRSFQKRCWSMSTSTLPESYFKGKYASDMIYLADRPSKVVPSGLVNYYSFHAIFKNGSRTSERVLQAQLRSWYGEKPMTPCAGDAKREYNTREELIQKYFSDPNISKPDRLTFELQTPSKAGYAELASHGIIVNR